MMWLRLGADLRAYAGPRTVFPSSCRLGRSFVGLGDRFGRLGGQLPQLLAGVLTELTRRIEVDGHLQIEGGILQLVRRDRLGLHGTDQVANGLTGLEAKVVELLLVRNRER